MFQGEGGSGGDVLQDPFDQIVPGGVINVDGEVDLPASSLSLVDQAIRSEYIQALGDVNFYDGTGGNEVIPELNDGNAFPHVERATRSRYHERP